MSNKQHNPTQPSQQQTYRQQFEQYQKQHVGSAGMQLDRHHSGSSASGHHQQNPYDLMDLREQQEDLYMEEEDSLKALEFDFYNDFEDDFDEEDLE
eukprot:403361836